LCQHRNGQVKRRCGGTHGNGFPAEGLEAHFPKVRGLFRRVGLCKQFHLLMGFMVLQWFRIVPVHCSCIAGPGRFVFSSWFVFPYRAVPQPETAGLLPVFFHRDHPAFACQPIPSYNPPDFGLISTPDPVITTGAILKKQEEIRNIVCAVAATYENIVRLKRS
jgi:hypothetical protein